MTDSMERRARDVAEKWSLEGRMYHELAGIILAFGRAVEAETIERVVTMLETERCNRDGCVACSIKDLIIPRIRALKDARP